MNMLAQSIAVFFPKFLVFHNTDLCLMQEKTYQAQVYY